MYMFKYEICTTCADIRMIMYLKKKGNEDIANNVQKSKIVPKNMNKMVYKMHTRVQRSLS